MEKRLYERTLARNCKRKNKKSERESKKIQV